MTTTEEAGSLSRITMLGTGAMGSRMATRLAAAGHDVTVWNRTTATAQALADEIGATLAPTPADAVAGSDVVIAMLTDDAASRSLWHDAGALAALPEGALAIECSTISPTWASELSRDMTTAHRSFVEAPILGSLPQVEQGKATALLGSSEGDVTAATPVLQGFCGRVEHVGEVGVAATLKVALNGYMAVQVAALSEVLALTAAQGIDEEMVVDLLPTLPLVSPQMARVVERMHARAFAPNFPIHLAAKDLGYVSDLDVPGNQLRMLGAAAASFNAAVAAGRGDLDMAGIADLPPR